MPTFHHHTVIATLAVALLSKSAAADSFHRHTIIQNQPQFSFTYSSGYVAPMAYYGHSYHRGWGHHHGYGMGFMEPPIVIRHHYTPVAWASPRVYDVFEYSEPGEPVIINQRVQNGAYSVTPGAVRTAEDGRYCREYQAKIVVGGRLQDSYGQACRQPDGSWEIVS